MYYECLGDPLWLSGYDAWLSSTRFTFRVGGLVATQMCSVVEGCLEFGGYEHGLKLKQPSELGLFVITLRPRALRPE